MDLESLVLPFDVKLTFYRIYGLARLEKKYLYLEFQSVENVLGVFKTRIKTVKVPLKELSSVELRKGRWGKQTLELKALYLHVFKGFPSALQGMCNLSIRRSDSFLAQKWTSQLELLRVEARYAPEDEKLNDFLNKPLPEPLLATWQKIKGFLN